MAYKEGDIVQNAAGEQLVLQNNQWVPVQQAPEGFAQPQEASIADQLQRQLGLTARAGVEGLTALPSMLAEIPRQALNLIPGVDFPPQQQAVSQLLSDIGLPQPETGIERIAGGGAQALASGGGMLKAAQMAPAAVSQLLTAAPGAQALSAGAGGMAGPAAGEMGFGPTGQMVAGMGASMLAPSVATGLQRAVTPSRVSPAQKLVEKALGRDIFPEDELLARAQALGKEGLIADIGGPNIRQLAQTITSVPGKAKAVAESTLRDRSLRSVRRLISDARKFAGADKDAFQTTKKIITERRELSRPLYEEANQQIVPMTDDLSGLLARPAMKQALNKGLSKARNDPDWPAGVVIPKSIDEDVPLAVLDYTKRALDDKIGAAIRAGNRDDARIFTGLKNQLTGMLDDQFPVYKQAREVFSDQSAMLKAMETGKTILKTDADEMLEFVADMPASEKEMFTLGAMKSITDRLKGTVEGANAARKIATDLVKERIRPAFPDDESFAQFVTGLERENVFMQTKGILGGSPTQQRLMSAGQFAGEVADIAAAPVSGTLNKVRAFLSREKGIPEKVRDEVAEILFSEAVANPKTFSAKIVRKLSQHKVPKSKLDALLENINTGTIATVATQNGQ